MMFNIYSHNIHFISTTHFLVMLIYLHKLHTIIISVTTHYYDVDLLMMLINDMYLYIVFIEH